MVDLAKAHLAAIKAMFVGNLRTNNSTYKLSHRSLLPLSFVIRTERGKCIRVHNSLGTNSGTSVLTVIETLSLIAQRPIKIVICPRRAGDLGCVVCSAAKAEKELGWKAEKGIVEMCRDLVNWQAWVLFLFIFSFLSLTRLWRLSWDAIDVVGMNRLNPEGYLTPDVVQ